MAVISFNSNYQWILSLKIVIISTGVLSMAVFLKLSVPVVNDFIVSEIPSIWSCFLSWLTPPYLYLLINCIIITILASSKLQLKLDDPIPDTPVVAKISSDVRTDNYLVYSYNTNQNLVTTKISEEERSRASEMEKKLGEDNQSLMVRKAIDEAPISSPMMNRFERKDSVGFSFSNEMEKPPVSSRIGQRKSIKASPEGKALGVTKPKRHDTLESTWRTITEGRSMPLTRHLKKSDTWDSHMRRNNPVQAAVDPITPPSKMKKSETFHERTGTGKASLSPSPSPGGSGKLRRESSLTQDELNRRVEAFIKKFNDEMRLQRQESLKQYQEMVGSGKGL